MYGPRAARLGRYLRLHTAACFSSSRVWSTTSNSSAHFPPVSKRARKVSPGVVPTCVGPGEGGRINPPQPAPLLRGREEASAIFARVFFENGAARSGRVETVGV